MLSVLLRGKDSKYSQEKHQIYVKINQSFLPQPPRPCENQCLPSFLSPWAPVTLISLCSSNTSSLFLPRTLAAHSTQAVFNLGFHMIDSSHHYVLYQGTPSSGRSFLTRYLKQAAHLPQSLSVVISLGFIVILSLITT